MPETSPKHLDLFSGILSAASHWPRSGRGFARWHMRNLTPKRRWCFASGSLASPISATFAPCAGSDFSARMAVLSSLRQAFHVSLQACLESGWVAQIRGGSGLTRSESFASYDPASSLLKIHQLSLALNLDGPSMESSLDLPRSGMMCCGELFRLPAWVLDISESGCVSLLPTPICNDGTGSQYCYGPKVLDGEERKKFLKLPGAVKQNLLPTATAADGERGGRGDLLAITRGKPNKHCKWALGPTPSTRQPISEADCKRNTPNLACHAAIRLLPTPTTRDYKDTQGMTAQRKDGTGRLEQLPRVVFAANLLPTLRANKRGVPDSHGKTEMWQPAFETSEGASPQKTGGMKLTPEFQCWLMGFHPDWLRPLRDALATPSSRRRSTRSSKPCTT